MSYFLDTVDTVPEGIGFSFYGSTHIIWLAIFAVAVAVCCVWYSKISKRGRSVWKKGVALLLVADEAFKVVMLIIGGNYTASYLPLHLCSINIFLIVWHAWKPSQILNSFLYTICIPGALAALLFPSWSKLPVMNFMHMHSFTVHILLALYPLVLTICGEIKPRLKYVVKCMLLLVIMAAVIYVVNLLLDTNFMFLMYAEEGNPLYIFEQMWGSHLLGFPVIIAGVLLVMYLPIELPRIIHKNKTLV